MLSRKGKPGFFTTEARSDWEDGVSLYTSSFLLRSFQTPCPRCLRGLLSRGELWVSELVSIQKTAQEKTGCPNAFGIGGTRLSCETVRRFPASLCRPIRTRSTKHRPCTRHWSAPKIAARDDPTSVRVCQAGAFSSAQQQPPNRDVRVAEAFKRSRCRLSAGCDRHKHWQLPATTAWLGHRTCSLASYQPITMFDSIALRDRSRSSPVCCM